METKGFTNATAEFVLPAQVTAGTGADTPDELAVREQAILASIQDLQRQLLEVRTAEERDVEVAAEIADATPNINRVLVVANRLPVTMHRNEDGHVSFRMSSGGLVTALQGTKLEMEFVWIGWLGGEVPEDEQDEIKERLWKEYKCVPVFITDELAAKFYNGFSNDVLWPLFHYVPLPMYKGSGEKKFDPSLWTAYKEANEQFAKVVMHIHERDDYIWVHDYHLMQLPRELRSRNERCRIAWFLHTPWPSSEVYRILPVRKPLLEGLLCADLLGFHTYDYARHFLSSCSRVLEVDSTPRGVEYDNHFTAVGVFPIGIDPDFISALLDDRKVKDRIKELHETFAGRKLILGVDRVDYIKGMPHKLLGLELFLTQHPEWREKVTLIQVGVPSRTSVPEYQALANHVNELVGRINGNFGTLEASPIHYINQSINQAELVAIYNVADACLVTSVRDGMNLVSHEFVAAQKLVPGVSEKDGPGVLILSEFAGSAQCLSGALRVNPWNTQELANTIHAALSMNPREKELKHQKLTRYVKLHTASYWARSLLTDFVEICETKPHLAGLPLLNQHDVLEAYKRAKKRLIVSDYDGTLTTLQSLPQLATPSQGITSILDVIGKDPKNTLLIMSGRERRFMDTWLGRLCVGLAAEHGSYYRLPGAEDWQTLCADIDVTWKKVVRPIMEYFEERTPGTYIEDKDSSLTWHYRDADPHFGSWQAKDMQMHMEDVLTNLPLEILQGNKVLEVRHRNANKSAVLETFLSEIVSAEEEQASQPPPAATEETDPLSDGAVATVLEQSAPSASTRTRSFPLMDSAETGPTALGGDNPFAQVDFVFCVGDDRSDEDMFFYLKRLVTEAQETSNSELKSSEGGVAPEGDSARPAQGGVVELSQITDPNKIQENGSAAAPVGVGSGLGLGLGLGLPSELNLESINVLGATPEPHPRQHPLHANAKVYTVHLGADNSAADYRIDNLSELRRVLKGFAKISGEEDVKISKRHASSPQLQRHKRDVDLPASA
mmetsp:Transcript_10631/g.40041  ORF Transcript_10631/g.40041 Transcript_10631/m.40041 type:complete len:1009 (-) Transcript_10631:187-3213(-)